MWHYIFQHRKSCSSHHSPLSYISVSIQTGKFNPLFYCSIIPSLLTLLHTVSCNCYYFSLQLQFQCFIWFMKHFITIKALQSWQLYFSHFNPKLILCSVLYVYYCLPYNKYCEYSTVDLVMYRNNLSPFHTIAVYIKYFVYITDPVVYSNNLSQSYTISVYTKYCVYCRSDGVQKQPLPLPHYFSVH